VAGPMGNGGEFEGRKGSRMIGTTPARKRRLAFFALLILLLAACAPFGPEATPTVSEPTPQPTIAPPTETPLPTPTPLPLPPPHLLSRSPVPGQEQPLDAPVELTFDQPMDTASVEAAFAITPAVDGAFTWVDDRTMTFATGVLERGERYAVTIADTAQNIEGTALEEPVLFDFDTLGYLAVSEVMPAPTSEDVDPDTTVTVVFNRPVVPLSAISRQG
jgi:hypothetical protein